MGNSCEKPQTWKGSIWLTRFAILRFSPVRDPVKSREKSSSAKKELNPNWRIISPVNPCPRNEIRTKGRKSKSWNTPKENTNTNSPTDLNISNEGAKNRTLRGREVVEHFSLRPPHSSLPSLVPTFRPPREKERYGVYYYPTRVLTILSFLTGAYKTVSKLYNRGRPSSLPVNEPIRGGWKVSLFAFKEDRNQVNTVQVFWKLILIHFMIIRLSIQHAIHDRYHRFA